jgi:hypothetical protein
MELQQRSKEGEILNSVTINVPVTGGWQTWQTITTKMNLNKNTGFLRLRIVAPEFNVNWIKFTGGVVSSTEKKQRQGKLNVYPNPTQKMLNIELPESIYRTNNALSIRQLNGTLVKRLEHASIEQVKSINIDGLSAGIYLIEFETKGYFWSNKVLIK